MNGYEATCLESLLINKYQSLLNSSGKCKDTTNIVFEENEWILYQELPKDQNNKVSHSKKSKNKSSNLKISVRLNPKTDKLIIDALDNKKNISKEVKKLLIRGVVNNFIR